MSASEAKSNDAELRNSALSFAVDAYSSAAVYSSVEEIVDVAEEFYKFLKGEKSE